MADTRKNGQFNETSYFDNIGGLNISDSPFKVLDTQSTGGQNYEYSQTGGIQKRRGAQVINTVADTQLRSHGIDLYQTTTNVKYVIRAADTKIQNFDTDTLIFTNLTKDGDNSSDVFPVNTTTPTAFAAFNTDTVSLLNFAGNTDGVYSIYSPTKFTKNGATAPAGSLSATTTIAGATTWQTTGTFYYAVSWHKIATGVSSNATLDLSVAVATTLQTNVINLTGVTAPTTGVYDYGTLYRSAVNGASGFTVGDIVTTFPVASTVVNDTGSAVSRTQTIPRAGSTVLDNSPLPAGTINVLTLWKRRLVTAINNVIYFSDLNKPESFPLLNTITIPSGGPITGLAVISFNTDYANDEYLAVFQERQLWLIKGNNNTDITLSFIDAVGCPSQSLITLANGFLCWLDYRGVYLWDGSGKPIYTSQPIEPYFSIDGDLDKTKLSIGTVSYFRNRNMIYWFLSSKVSGEQKLAIKMDLRLTLPNVNTTMGGRVMPGVFVDDVTTSLPIYAAKTYLPTASQDEVMLVGDASGFVYRAYQQFSDNGVGIDFQYYTPFVDLGSPNVDKRFHKVVLWVDAVGNWPITLDYWAGYRAALAQKSTLSAPVTTQATNATALWDVAYWDQAYWDDYTQALSPVVFNLNNAQSNCEGDCIRLRFRNAGVDQPVTIYGYSIFWTEKGLNK